MKRLLAVLIAGSFLIAGTVVAQTKRVTRDPASQPTETLATPDWRTPAEISDYKTTPRYDETMAYVNRLAKAAPKQVKVETFGKTGDGRDLVAVIVSADGVFDPAKIHAANRPIVYIQNAIHAGEMDGKDASLALLRDIVVSKKQVKLIEHAVLIVNPIYNADGHEWFGPYNRINQNGPEQMGWRTTARQLNLNRDYVKADAPETRAFLQLFNKYLPDLFVDNHVTDGADYQYDTTYAFDAGPDVNAPLAEWIRGTFKPYIEKSVTEAGHVIGEYVGVGEANPLKGLRIAQDTPRFSTGYMVLQNRPGLLVEMHMLKDYRTRVTGNYELLRAMLEVVNRDAQQLVKMNRDADAATVAAGSRYDDKAAFPLRLKSNDESTTFHFLGYKRTETKSDLSGGTWVQYTHEPMNIDIPLYATLTPSLTVAPPRAYIVPAAWTQVIDVLRAHGIRMSTTTKTWTGEVDTYRCTSSWSAQPYEGRHPMSSGELFQQSSGLQCKPVREKIEYPAGSVVVPMDQRAAKVAIHWLEPEGPDSALNWGLFDAIFEQKEYGESYVLEKLARDMIAKDPKLKDEFEAAVAADKQLAASPFAKLNWFYKRSPWWDSRVGLYPVGRLRSMEGVPVK